METYLEELLYSVQTLRKEIKRISYDVYRGSELTIPQLGVVAILAEKGPQKVGELAEQIGLANSTVSGIIDRLSRKGILERSRLEEDRRTVVITLTEGSERYYEEYTNMRNAFLMEKLKGIDRREAEKITDAINRLSSLLS